MKPTVGRIVHFYTDETHKWRNGQGNGPYAAIITQVFEEASPGFQYVNLKVLPYGDPWDEGSVSVKETFADQSRYWEWPPIAPSTGLGWK